MAIKRLYRPAEIAIGRGPAEVRRRLGRIDARATANGACRAIDESPAAALPPVEQDLAEKAVRIEIEGEDRG